MSSATSGEESLSILIIDDEQHILDALRKFLEARGHRLSLSTHARQAMEILDQIEIDVVITDVRMPEMDGFQVLHEVKQRAPDTEVIVMTEYGDIDLAVRVMREGAFDFFSKPLKMRELAASLQRTARFHALRQEKDRYRERLDHLAAEAHRSYGLEAIVGDSPAIWRMG